MTVSLTLERKCKTKRKIKGLLDSSLITIRQLAEVIGILVSNLPGVAYGRLYYRHLEFNKINSLRAAKGDFDAKTTLTSLSRLELLWWLSNIDEAFCHIHHKPVGAVLECDASTLGWGAVLRSGNQSMANDRWSRSQRKFHVNVLELLAIYFGLKALCKALRGQHVGIRSDNMTAVSYINHMGGTKSSQCNEVTKIIWLWCKDNDIWISAAHIPGAQNGIADHLSRNGKINTEWALNDKIFLDITSVFGCPDINLFATNEKYRAVSWRYEPQAHATDAFSFTWTDHNFYAFPPFSMIGRCLQKIELEQATGILIAPVWTTQASFVKLMELLIAVPLLLPVSKERQSLYAQGISPKAADIILEAWRPSTQKQYLVYLSRWLLFCSKRNIDPMQTDLKEILNFLVELFEGGVGYSGINTARSMLSSFVLIPKNIGKNNLVKRFVKGIFELKTPRPHRCHVWDVSTVFQYVKSLEHNAELTLKFLTYKAVILATLISAQRVQTLSQLDLDFMEMTEQSFIFHINDKLKQTRPGHVGLQICFDNFSEDELLCIYSVLKIYIQKTENLRTSSKLFISYRK
ncbi:hypothetical protein HOLleu_26478 [Holothuria leucospilota]|uniref:RNase H type-1 domain-containing protein n=1 Tax=Holothuria leucospilota TaxID=206669 RepID=A0A9Q1H2V1_HOLLE|nr:hypothetical protein HOLleu_26478 [Holothuria leucospilota]